MGVGVCAPEQVAAQRTERFAMSAHASLGFGGEVSECWDFTGGSTGFYDCDVPRNDLTERLRPSPGLGLRIAFVGWRYVSLGVSATVRSLATSRDSSRRFTDLGLTVGMRYPLELGRAARLVTPYVAFTGGLSTLHDTFSARSRMQDPGYHLSGVAGLEVELVPGFGLYVESGVTHMRIQIDARSYSGTLLGHHEFTAIHAVLNLGLRVAR